MDSASLGKIASASTDYRFEVDLDCLWSSLHYLEKFPLLSKSASDGGELVGINGHRSILSRLNVRLFEFRVSLAALRD